MSATVPAQAWGVKSATANFESLDIVRRVAGPTDVAIEIAYAGICHSDLHTVRGDWGPTPYPSVPGHEIVGTVTAVGADVKKYKVGDFVGVGCMVDSCRTCSDCKQGFEQHCEAGNVGTYGAKDKHQPWKDAYTMGGYSTAITVDEDFVLRIPESLDKAAAAPLLCAGITTYSPLRQAGVTKGSKVGVVGLGGLGHMAVKIAAAMGAEVTMITTTASKAADAERLGAKHVLLSKDAEAMKAAVNTLDFIIDTVSATHDVVPLIALLKTRGKLCFVGAPPTPHAVPAFPLIMGNKQIFGSLIGGIPETQEMLDFCAEHNILPDTEMIKADSIDVAYERLLKSDVKYRFVIDIHASKKQE